MTLKEFRELCKILNGSQFSIIISVRNAFLILPFSPYKKGNKLTEKIQSVFFFLKKCQSETEHEQGTYAFFIV